MNIMRLCRDGTQIEELEELFDAEACEALWDLMYAELSTMDEATAEQDEEALWPLIEVDLQYGLLGDKLGANYAHCC